MFLRQQQINLLSPLLFATYYTLILPLILPLILYHIYYYHYDKVAAVDAEAVLAQRREQATMQVDPNDAAHHTTVREYELWLSSVTTISSLLLNLRWTSLIDTLYCSICLQCSTGYSYSIRWGDVGLRCGNSIDYTPYLHTYIHTLYIHILYIHKLYIRAQLWLWLFLHTVAVMMPSKCVQGNCFIQGSENNREFYVFYAL